MIFSKIKLSIISLSILAVVSCGGGDDAVQVGEQGLRNESDSLAYVLGLSVAQNLIKMDSTINLEAVSIAIAHAARGEERLSQDDARTTYLRYMLYVEPQRRRAYEESYLEEFSKSQGEFARTKSGLTFKIVSGGDEKKKPKANTDWVEYVCSISRVDGEVVAKDVSVSLPFEDLVSGVQESLKMIGSGGEIVSWLPSKLAYADAGDEKLKIAPFETLRFEIKLNSVESSTMEKNRVKKSKF
ncbi:MAG: FKBP-type peptidyl-prolyl cis-trans isomerase N-terminal domain-containing protein [Rikenellaceae bacterium]